ncbi:sensor histidine kinase [Pseudalkalibacillus sp. R45]|uniref:sensor histidine kinase n=1 Tax=Pseudalkalibacillus sp. R45 TaxID=3457433 RepID=UPI003FCCC2BF
MLQRLLNVSLQIKILGLIIFLLLLVIGLLSFIVGYLEMEEDVEQAERIALQTAQTLSFMGTIQDSVEHGGSFEVTNPIVERMRDQVDASAIRIENREGELTGYAGDIITNHSSPRSDRYRSLVFGSNYVTRTDSDGGEVLKGIAPIMIDYGDYKKVEGTATVIFHMDIIQSKIASDIKKMLLVSGVAFIVGIAGSFFLAKSIRKDTHGLEPYEIGALYRERNAILQSVKEGILSIDEHGIITMMNHSARELLDISESVEGQSVTSVISSSSMLEVLASKETISNKELYYNDKIVIVNTQPIIEDGEQAGIVASFRDKTEIKKMVDALSEVRQYSEDLRAQAHEFTNKLYVILGMIQLGKHTEAIELIQEEAQIQEQHKEVLLTNIKDEKVQAILLGKLAKASEKKIDFIIDVESAMQPLPAHIGFSPLIVILGNLIDNAFEAVADRPMKEVSFFVTDIGNDIIFEIADSGKGIKGDAEGNIFQKGYSAKGKNRGYGLANLKEEVELLDGMIEWTNSHDGGAVFTVILPKTIKKTNTI